MKRLLLRIGSSVFKSLLLLTAVAFATLAILGSSGFLKKSLKESGIYGSFVGNALKSSQQQTTQSTDIPLDRPEVQQAVEKSFTPELLQHSTEQVIDGTYNWLDGTTATPDFRVDFTDAKAALATNLGDYAVTRYQGLPACTVAQLQQLADNVDPLNMSCQVRGLDISQVRQAVTNQVSSNKDFLSEPVITASTLKGNNGQSVFDQYKSVPVAFRWLKAGTWILGAVTILTGLGLVLLRHDKRRGLRTVGFSLLLNGVFLGCIAGLTIFLFNHSTATGGQLTQLTKDSAFQASMVTILRSFNTAFNHWLLGFALGYGIIGIGILLGLHSIKPHADKIVASSPVSGSKY